MIVNVMYVFIVNRFEIFFMILHVVRLVAFQKHEICPHEINTEHIFFRKFRVHIYILLHKSLNIISQCIRVRRSINMTQHVVRILFFNIDVIEIRVIQRRKLLHALSRPVRIILPIVQ